MPAEQTADTAFPVDSVEGPDGGFGPSFRSELAAAGVSTLPFVVFPDHVIFGPSIEATDRSKVMAVIEAHDPSKPAPAPVPDSVADYQFAGQAAAEGIIDYDAAKAWAGPGTVPQVLLDAVDGLLAAGQIDADRHSRVILFLMGTKDFPRHHDLTPILAASFGKDTPAKLDAFFVAASQR